ncbi:MAG TPA: hypothetical protein VFX11_09445 [Candidatus Kapabacteria bacterium]|nr:hypothetical protein [Candidatus Kapabacteria bacterium]
MKKCTQERFLNDVARHEMQILHEDGLYRHVRFKRPDSGCMHFDLITYPGYLVFSGDMGCYVFSRLTDMFEFFRTDRRDYPDGDQLRINLGYWSEKLQAVDGNRDQGSAKEFSEEKFNRAVVGDLIAWIRSYSYQTTKDERRRLWDAVMCEVIGEDSDSGGYRKQAAVHDFYHDVNSRVGRFSFQDFWEHDVTDYTFRFVWCCYALAWGIAKYDDNKGHHNG